MSRNSGLSSFKQWAGVVEESNNNISRQLQVPSISNNNHSSNNNINNEIMKIHMKILQSRQQNVLYKQAIAKKTLSDSYNNNNNNYNNNNQNNQYNNSNQFNNNQNFQQQQQQEILTGRIAQLEKLLGLGGSQDLFDKVSQSQQNQVNLQLNQSKKIISNNEISSLLSKSTSIQEMATPKIPGLNLGSMIKAKNIVKSLTRRDDEVPSIELPKQQQIKSSKRVEREILKAIEQQQAPMTKNILMLAEDIEKTLETNKKLLDPNLISKDQDKILQEAGNRKLEMKNRINNLLKNKSNDYKMPLWRHQLLGEDNPVEDKILRGKELWRVVTLGIIALYIRPKLNIKKRNLVSKTANREDLSRTINLYSDACDAWLGKLIKVPLLSLDQDPSLDFTLIEMVRLQPLKHRMLQLKVRVKTIVESIVNSEKPHDHIINFLVKLVDDGNYFKSGFLYNFEKKIFEFNEMGATRNMCYIIPNNDNNKDKEKNKNRHIIYVGDKIKRRIDATRIKILVRDFIMIRILINHLLLSPWQSGLCPKPNMKSTSKVTRLIKNCRVLASVFYQMVRSSDTMKLIPPIEISKANLSDLLSMLDDGDDEITKKIEESENIEDKKKKNEKKKKMKEEESLKKMQDMEKDKEDGDDNKDEEKKNEENNDEEKKDEIKDEPGFVTKLLTMLLGASETKDARTHEIEEILVNPRYPYQSLTSTHQLLLIESSFEYAEEFIGGWIRDYAVQLNQWIDTIVQLVVERRTEKLMSESPLTEEDLEFIGSAVEEIPTNNKKLIVNVEKKNDKDSSKLKKILKGKGKLSAVEGFKKINEVNVENKNKM